MESSYKHYSVSQQDFMRKCIFSEIRSEYDHNNLWRFGLRIDFQFMFGVICVTQEQKKTGTFGVFQVLIAWTQSVLQNTVSECNEGHRFHIWVVLKTLSVGWKSSRKFLKNVGHPYIQSTTVLWIYIYIVQFWHHPFDVARSIFCI